MAKTEIGFVKAHELRALNDTVNDKNEKLFEQYGEMLSNFLQAVAKEGNYYCELKDFYEYVNTEDEFDVFWLDDKLSEFGYVALYTDTSGDVISWRY